MLFWDRRRPRLPTLPLPNLSGDKCRRGRLRSQKSTSDTPTGLLKGNDTATPSSGKER